LTWEFGEIDIYSLIFLSGVSNDGLGKQWPCLPGLFTPC
jgi:hypothetical protein